MSAAIRLTARVIYAPETPKTKHFQGIPPRVTGESDDRQLMESPALVLIEEKSDGIFLYRFTADRRCVGDTWHQTIEAAKRQAVFEFDELLSAWQEVPANVTDIISFGLAANI